MAVARFSKSLNNLQVVPETGTGIPTRLESVAPVTGAGGSIPLSGVMEIIQLVKEVGRELDNPVVEYSEAVQPDSYDYSFTFEDGQEISFTVPKDPNKPLDKYIAETIERLK